MKIPSNAADRQDFYWEVIDHCFSSRSKRVPFYNNMRMWYLFGTDGEQVATFNKIGPHVDLVTSFLFSHETTRFSIDLSPSVSSEESLKCDKMSQAINAAWHDSNCDTVFGEALKWSLVYDSCFIKLWWKSGITPYIVEPHQIGVYREDFMGMDRQEAICMRYTVTKSQLESEFKGHPRLNEILNYAPAGTATEDGTGLPTAVQNIILSSASPTITGNAQWQNAPENLYNAEVSVDTVTCYELWLWNDKINDYQIVTMVDPGYVLLDRPNVDPDTGRTMFVPKEHPFVQLCPRPMYKYFWGASEVQNLAPLQAAITHRFNQIKKLLEKQVDPPKAGMGITGDVAEITAALFSAGGYVGFPDAMNAKIEEFKPQIPTDVYAEIRELDNRFEEMSGISGIMKGEGAPGVRSKGQTTALARMGSSRIKQRAGVIEDSLEKIATLIGRLIQINDPTVLTADLGGDKKLEFVASQFTKDYTVKVDAHSMSPLFVEDEKELAFALFERKCIKRERLLKMVHPSGMQELLEELKHIEAEEAARAKMEMKMQQAELAAKYAPK